MVTPQAAHKMFELRIGRYVHRPEFVRMIVEEGKKQTGNPNWSVSKVWIDQVMQNKGHVPKQETRNAMASVWGLPETELIWKESQHKKS